MELIRELAQYRFIAHDDAADQIYRSFSAAVKRTGSADSKIAAVAQAHGAVVVLRGLDATRSVADVVEHFAERAAFQCAE